MRHLVFTAKSTGLKCVEFVLDRFPEDEYTFVVCEPDADVVGAALARRGHRWNRLSDETLQEIRRQEPSHYDWLLNLWGGHIFKEDVLSRAKRTLNIHPAFLPYCRGRDPVVWALRYGYPAGVALHEITNGVDEGPILYREEVSYALPCSGGELYARVVDRAWRAFCEQWPRLREAPRAADAQVSLPECRTFRRSDLLRDRRIDADTDAEARAVVLRLLAHDFGGDYCAEVVLDGKLYAATLKLTPHPEE